ncbi:MAG: reverse transcriptase domain-containing protein, partial [Blastocatellia bacterium]
EYARDLEANIDSLAARLREGRYYPLPVKNVDIPKPGGGVRTLGIYTLDDSIVQRAAKDILEPVFEPSFLPCSFGFRPGRNVPMAVKQVLDWRAAGDMFLVDADISDCFGSLDHDLLMQLFAARIRDKRFQQLIRLWLDTGRVLPKPGQDGGQGLPERIGEWLSDSADGVVSGLLGDRLGGYGYGYGNGYQHEYQAPGGYETADEPGPGQLRRQARAEALKRAGGAGLMWALTYAGRAGRLMSPAGLALTGAAVIAAAATPMVTRKLGQWRNGEADRLHGIVQGGAISPLLCNLYMHELDVAMTQAGFRLARYADDFVVCCRDEAEARRAMNLAAQQLSAMRLRLHPQKTRMARFDEGIEFLGYRFAQFENTAAPISPQANTPVVRAWESLRGGKKTTPPPSVSALHAPAPEPPSGAATRFVRVVRDKATRLGQLLPGGKKESGK